LLGYSSPEELKPIINEDYLWAAGPHWKLWLFDLDTQTAAPIEGIGEDLVSGWSQFSVLDGRTFVFLPYDDGRRTKAYELTAEGAAVERFDTLGDVFKWVRVR
ncbi:MAG TPA: hypothetical protein VGC79_32070, partial [Polyangiaceae bacterium]